MTSPLEEQAPPLAEAWKKLKEDEPRLRARDAARRLGVAEAVLLTTKLGSGVTRLRAEVPELLKSLEPLGKVMGITRNEYAVHELHGVYKKFVFQGVQAFCNNADIDLRLDLREWKAVFAETAQAGPRTLRSLQVFDAAGVAVHKIYLTEDSSIEAYEALVAAFADEPLPFVPTESPAVTPLLDATEEQKTLLLEGWSQLQDTHQFMGLLAKTGVDRLAAFRAAEGKFTRRIGPTSLRSLLEAAVRSELHLMVFVANPGCLQIHTGPIDRIRPMDGWTNILDRDFNLHVDDAAVAEAYVVTKPTKDGDVTSVELFAQDGTQIVQLFGERKPGRPELAAWTALATSLPSS